MKKSLTLFLAVSCILCGSVTSFASDVGKDKVPKKEKLFKETVEASIDLNVITTDFYQVVNEVTTSNFVVSDEKEVKITKAEKSYDFAGLLETGLPKCSNDKVLFIKHKTSAEIKNYIGYCRDIDVWKDKIKQCLYHAERSPQTA